MIGASPREGGPNLNFGMIDKIMRNEVEKDGDQVLKGITHDWMKSLSVNVETVTNDHNKELMFRMLSLKMQKMVEKANKIAAAHKNTGDNSKCAENKKELVSKNELKLMATGFIAKFKG